MVYAEWIVKSPDYFGQIIVIFIECGYINGHMCIPKLVVYLLLRKMCIVRHYNTFINMITLSRLC